MTTGTVADPIDLTFAEFAGICEELSVADEVIGIQMGSTDVWIETTPEELFRQASATKRGVATHGFLDSPATALQIYRLTPKGQRRKGTFIDFILHHLKSYPHLIDMQTASNILSHLASDEDIVTFRGEETSVSSMACEDPDAKPSKTVVEFYSMLGVFKRGSVLTMIKDRLKAVRLVEVEAYPAAHVPGAFDELHRALTTACRTYQWARVREIATLLEKCQEDYAAAHKDRQNRKKCSCSKLFGHGHALTCARVK